MNAAGEVIPESPSGVRPSKPKYITGVWNPNSPAEQSFEDLANQCDDRNGAPAKSWQVIISAGCNAELMSELVR